MMIKKSILTLLVIATTTLSYAAPQGRPGVLVNPTRVVMEGRERSAVISIVNNGTKTGFYKILLVNKRMSEGGALQDIDTPLPDEKFADGLIRISPRRVTLAPGEHQNIRLLVRKPKDLEAGEYRTHLNIVASSEEEIKQDEGTQNDGTFSIQIRASFGVTIPVIVRHGALEAAANIVEVKRFYSSEDKKQHVKVTMERIGNQSLYGDLRITHVSPSGEKTVLRNMAGVAVYTPNTTRVFDVAMENGVHLDSGMLEVEYLAKEDDGGGVLASGQLKLF
jgi:P pilus assembly chaperone PapD